MNYLFHGPKVEEKRCRSGPTAEIGGAKVASKELARRAELATVVIREAATIATSYYRRRSGMLVKNKGIQDVVSEADRACEDLIVERLSSAFPEDSFLCEESGFRQKGPLTWVIDPIDGTANFVRGINHWCISIGLLEGESPLLGLLLDPIANELFSAEIGRGAFMNGSPIRVSGETDLTRARIGIGFQLPATGGSPCSRHPCAARCAM